MEELDRHEEVADDIRRKFEALWESLKEAVELGMDVKWCQRCGPTPSREWNSVGSVDLRVFAEPKDYEIAITRRVEF